MLMKLTTAVSSPTKRRTRNSDVIGDVINTDNQKANVDLPQSSKDFEKENIDDSNKSQVKTNDDEEYLFKVEEKYVPPPPLPFTLRCPDQDCRKGFRHPDGLRYHVSLT